MRDTSQARDERRGEPPLATPEAESHVRHTRALARGFLIAAWAFPVIMILTLAWLQWQAQGSGQGTPVSVADFRARVEVSRTPAPDFTMPILGSSDSLSLSSFRGEVVVVNFWGSWCGPCRREAPDLESTWRAYRSQGVRFLGVDEQDDEGAALAFVKEFGITYPSVVDDNASAVAGDYRVFGLPTTVIVDRRGRIVYRLTGYLDAAVLRSALDDVLQG